MTPTITIALVVAFALPAIWVFNRMVRLRNTADGAWSDVAVQLKRRHDLVPALVEVVRAYSAHEAEALAAAVRASAADGADVASSEQALSTGLVAVFALAEHYPELLAHERFAALHRELVSTEDDIEAARRYFNAVVRDLNSAIETFPGVLVASAFGIGRRDYFELGSVAAKLPPVVDLGGAARPPDHVGARP